jgi:hypothetical protein
MKKVSASAKASLSAEIQAEITKLTNLKIKIVADTDAAVLKNDVKSITGSYRIYALIMPQISLLAAADRVQVLAGNFETVIVKLQTRINEAAAAGKDTSAMTSALATIKIKVADSKVQADAAAMAVASLTPDNGDKVKMEANSAALKNARAKLKVATDDLKEAQKEMNKIFDGTKGLKADLKLKATTTVSH